MGTYQRRDNQDIASMMQSAELLQVHGQLWEEFGLLRGRPACEDVWGRKGHKGNGGLREEAGVGEGATGH